MKNFCQVIPLFFIFIFSSLNAKMQYALPAADEIHLVEFVKESIQNAYRGESKLNASIYAIEGASSPKVRDLLNNLCSKPHTRYLEIGILKGSTFISALHENQSSIISATAIDINRSIEFTKNTNKFLLPNSFQFILADCYTLDPAYISASPFNIYFYDGEHSFLDQERAFTHFDSILDKVFIAIVDDWNWDPVKKGTHSAFDKLNYTILYENELPARFNGDLAQWWNGLYIAVIRKL